MQAAHRMLSVWTTNTPPCHIAGMGRPTPSSIRFPRPLQDRPRAHAEAEHRTFSGTVLHLVQVDGAAV